MSRLKKGVNDFKTWCSNAGLFGKQLMFEWTGLCEDGKQYAIDQVARASGKKFKWRCSKNHEWFASVASRTGCKSGCPYCFMEVHGDKVAKGRISTENSFKTWCSNNSSLGRQLMSEWTGECVDGKQYKIDEVTRASHKKFKWRCSKNHEWLASVYSRTISKSGCPYCAIDVHGARVAKGKLSAENNLKTWCFNAGSFGKQLMSEWTGECDDGRQYKIDEVTRGSNKKFKWRCSKNHEWFATILNRTLHKTDCPYCRRIMH